MTEALKHVVNIKHKDNKILLDYFKYLKQGRDILEVHVSKDVLGNYVEYTDELKNAFEAENKKKINSGEFNTFMAYLLIAN